MTLAQLHAKLGQMLAEGNHPDTKVVIDDRGGSGWYHLIEEVTDPLSSEDYDQWVTLFPGREADSRRD